MILFLNFSKVETFLKLINYGISGTASKMFSPSFFLLDIKCSRRQLVYCIIPKPP